MQLSRTLFFLFLFVFSGKYYAQYNGLGFSYPLDRDIVVTGNYGEIRPNHFHAGLDFSTDPSKNLPIKSVADGYVSRIKISSGGYGRVLYVTHANGYVSVYAHQKRYATKIDAYIKQKQIEQKKNEIEIYPEPTDLVVKKGEVLGYTGNTGSSTGPHLHFEIREEKSEFPINPLLVYSVKDDIKPTLTHIAIYDTQDTNHISQKMVSVINPKAGKSGVMKSTYILDKNTFALAFAGYDQANGTTNKNNIYEVKLKLDSNLIYHHQLNTISFDNGRYVNYFSEKINGAKFQKCFTPTCYDINIYKKTVNGGKIELRDTLFHSLELSLADEKGNTTQYVFYVRSKKVTTYKTSGLCNAICNRDCHIKKDDIELTIKAGSLVNSTFVAAYINKLGKAAVGNKNDLLLKPFDLSIKIYKPFIGREDKMIAMNDDHCLVGKYENGWFKTESKSFGVFSISYDTITPTVNCTTAKKNQANISANKSISFKIDDKLSGIADYAVYINDVWQIAEYDAKSDMVTCYFDENTPKGDITIKAEVLDRVGNKGVYEFKTKR